MSTAAIDPGYQAAKDSAAWFPLPLPGLLLFSGATRVDYLQRQSTNDLGLLVPGQAVPNVLTNPSGRILEVFTLLQLGEDIAMLTQPGHAPGLAAYFKKRIFFNDQVSVEDDSANWVQWELYGPQAPATLAALGFAAAPSLDQLLAASIEGRPLYALGEEGRTRLLLPAALAEHPAARLSGLAPLSSAARELLRIEAGQAGDPEFTDANTPFEVGLDRYVSASKGCYTGQEVLARQVTYDKVVRGLARLSAQAPMPAEAAVSREGKAVGQVSSAAVSPSQGPLALAVLRKPFEPGDQVQVQSPGGLLAARIL